MSIIQWIFDHKWAITPQALEAVIDIGARMNELAPEKIAEAMHGSIWERYFNADGSLRDFQALEANNYPIMEGTRRVSLAKNVAILPVIGPIFPRASLLTMSGGGASVQSLAYDFNLALENNAVDAIILNFDSPGGEVTGISEFSDMIFKAQARKSIVSYVYGMGASAAYWLASSASEIVVGNTVEVGSIGVVAAYSSSKRDREKRGIDDYEIVSSQSPKKRPDPSTDAGKAQIQATVDQLADIFISTVARNRGITVADVLTKYGQGGLLVGEDAVSNGMADRVGSLESLIEEQQNVKQFNFFVGGSMTLAELKSQHPAVYAEAVAVGRGEAEAEMPKKIETARNEGAVAESKRIQDIESIVAPGAEAVVKEHKFNREMTKDKVSGLVLQAQQAEIERIASASQTDAAKLLAGATGLGQASPSSVAQDAEEQMVVAAMTRGIDSRVPGKK